MGVKWIRNLLEINEENSSSVSGKNRDEDEKKNFW